MWVKNLSPKPWHQTTNGKLTILGTILVVIFIIFMYPSGSDATLSVGNSKYAVVIDAGSSGSRVHVYEISVQGSSYAVEDELFEQLKPGLSAYPTDPVAAAKSLDPLLAKAVARVPTHLHATTPIGVGATAGLRMLGEDMASKILDSVRDHLRSNYDFKLKSDHDVRILDGNEEGKYAWIAVNTLLGQVGNVASETYSACDLGGGSVQCMFALPSTSASLRKGALSDSDLPATYVETVNGGGRDYNLYVHSFLGYGLLAARKAVLKVQEAAAGCMPTGFDGEYEYGGESVSAKGSGDAAFSSCRAAVQKALKSDQPCDASIEKEAPVPDSECTINGQWVGGLASLLKQNPKFQLHLMSFFYERTKSVGAGTAGKELDEREDESSLQILRRHAENVCTMSAKELETARGVHLDNPEDLPYLCLDVSYIYSFLVDGIGVQQDTKYVMEKKINVNGKDFEAAWSLGMAMELL